MTLVARLLNVLLLILLAAGNALAQRPSEIERVAALRFAMANGFQIPPGVTVARETFVDSGRPRPSPTRPDLRERDAQALAAEITPAARVGSAAPLVSCTRHVCWGATAERLLVVSDPEATPQQKAVVGLTLYSRDSSGADIVSGAVVLLERVEGGWVGVSYTVGPFSGRPRIPP
jgi:hypothetical protein